MNNNHITYKPALSGTLSAFGKLEKAAMTQVFNPMGPVDSMFNGALHAGARLWNGIQRLRDGIQQFDPVGRLFNGAQNLGTQIGQSLPQPQQPAAPPPPPAQPATPHPPPVPSTPAQPPATAPATAPAPPVSPPNYARIMGSYNPNSSLDQRKKRAIDSLYALGITSPNAIYSNSLYKNATASQVSPFAILEKSAYTAASSAAAKALAATRPAFKGGWWNNLKNGVMQGGKSIGGPSTGKGLAYNTGRWGLPTLGGGSLLAGSNLMGRSSGHAKGYAEGTDKGFDLGSEKASDMFGALSPQDPGFMGRLMELFTGRQSGPDASALKMHMQEYKKSLIEKALAEGRL